MCNISGSKNNTIKIVFTIFAIILVAILGSVFVNLGMDWFSSLNKPTQWIPNIIIPIVWSVIYGLFGVVLSIWIARSQIPTKTIVLLVVNGVLNVIWCLIFFTLHLTFVGNIIIILNLIAGILLLIDIYLNDNLFAYLTMLYPIWLSIATTLNTALWILN